MVLHTGDILRTGLSFLDFKASSSANINLQPWAEGPAQKLALGDLDVLQSRKKLPQKQIKASLIPPQQGLVGVGSGFPLHFASFPFSIFSSCSSGGMQLPVPLAGSFVTWQPCPLLPCLQRGAKANTALLTLLDPSQPAHAPTLLNLQPEKYGNVQISQRN